jgi:PAS domain S-box-containing protein
MNALTSPLRLLHLEDDRADADLVRKTLENEGVICTITRVDTATDFRASLERGGFHLILADYTLPEFDGMSALTLAREIAPDVPFMFVSGTLSEEVAIEALKRGATDYLFKTRLSRIVPCVHRALREAEERAERRRAEEALRRSEAYFRLIVDSIPGLVCTTTAAGAIERVNQRILDYTGKTLDELQHWEPLIHPDDLARVTTEWMHSVETGHRYDIEHRFLQADGVYRWFHVLGQPLLDPEGRIVRWYNLLTDIDERKRAEEELRRSRAFLAEAQGISHTGSFGWSVASGDIYWSDETYNIFEYDREVGPTLALVLARVHPDDTDRVRQTIDRASETRADLDFEHRLLMPDGSIKHLRVVGHADGDRSSELEFVGAVTDVTERRRAEDTVRQAQAELAHMARVSTLGAMAASIAHEVNQPLSGIVTNAGASLRFLRAEPPNLDEVRDGLHAIVRDGRRASDVIARIRGLVRRTAAEKAPLDINEVIREVVVLAEGEARRTGALLRTRFAGDLPRVPGDRVQLQQVILNLLLNGLDAMAAVASRPREVVISTRPEAIDRVCVSVHDAGCGIDPEVLSKIFEPFYTTKGKGLGMGLSISRSIVEQHGGRLWAVPNDGPGTTFHFTL